MSELFNLTSESLHPPPPPTCFLPVIPLPFSLSPALLIVTAITLSDEGGGMHSRRIKMWVNFNPPPPPNTPDALLRSAYLLYTGFLSCVQDTLRETNFFLFD